MKKIVVLLVICLLLVGCAEKNKNYTLKLDGNYSTGYTWEYVIETEGIVEVVKDTYETEETDLVGAPGTQIYEFKGLKEGKTKITFTYAKSFEENSEVETKVITLEVDKNLNVKETNS